MSKKDRKQDDRDLGPILAQRLLSLRPGVRPDQVSSYYHDRGVSLNVQVIAQKEGEGSNLVLIEGDQEALLFLADLLLAQASDTLDCGFQILIPAAGLLSKKSKYGLYVHVLPCPHTREET